MTNDEDLSSEILDLIHRKGYRKFTELKDPETLEEVLIKLCKWVPAHNRLDRNAEIQRIVHKAIAEIKALKLLKEA